jgi:hypothetical protein
MARKPMVTRTIVTTNVKVMAVEVPTGATKQVELTLPRTYKDEKKLLKTIQDSFDTDELKHVHIISKEEVETLYGMSELKFIENSTILDNETRKPVEE